MKTINEKFTDEEFDKLKDLKGKLSWHDFFLFITNSDEEAMLLREKETKEINKVIEKLHNENQKLKEELKKKLS